MSLGGTWGRILHVDLSNRGTWEERLPDEIYTKLIGGRALACYLLLRDLRAHSEPLGPDNLLVFAPGVLQGTHLPGTGRHGLGARSPLTGALGSSEAGGWWGHEFKRAGYDALLVHGRAQSPVYIWLKDGSLEIRLAEHLWGRDTAEVQEMIRAELGDDQVRVAQCGVAGENAVRFASVMHDVNRAAGRNGLGAVMGSKNLRAVAVRGTMSVPIAARTALVRVSKWLGEEYSELANWAVDMGTPIAVSGLAEIGGLPTRNFQDPAFEGASRISGELMHATLLADRDTCQVCPIRCKQVVEYHGQEYPEYPELGTPLGRQLKIDRAYGGPEYESLAALGSACGVDDLVAVAKANELCARWGLDTISTGMTIAFVMECVERGLITSQQTEGFLPRWGEPQSLLTAVDLIAHRRGFGEQMAEGTRRLAEHIGNGADAYAMHVKGQEIPLHEPRLKFAMGVGYAVAPVGADHQMNMHDTDYVGAGFPLERVSEVYPVGPLRVDDLGSEKMRLFYHEVNWMHFLDCAVVCQFYPYKYSHLSDVLSGVTGVAYRPEEVLAVGERAQTLARLFNLREGFNAEDDRLPKRVMQAFRSGPLANVEITESAFIRARNEWYGLMGWTGGGVPTRECISRLGLSNLLGDISDLPLLA